LFKNYPPLAKRRPVLDGYDKAVNRVCLRFSHVLDDDKNIRTYRIQLQSRFTNYRKLARQNREEGRQLLIIKSQQFIPLPFESDNLIISSISKNLSRGFRSYKLKIQFCDKFGNSAGETLVFDPIMSVELVDWWHPKYEEMLKS